MSRLVETKLTGVCILVNVNFRAVCLYSDVTTFGQIAVIENLGKCHLAVRLISSHQNIVVNAKKSSLFILIC